MELLRGECERAVTSLQASRSELLGRTPEQVSRLAKHRWRRLTLLALHVVQAAWHTAIIHAVETANGSNKKELLFAPSGTKGASRKHTATSTILQARGFGAELPPSDGRRKTRLSMEECPHAMNDLSTLGNGKMIWWKCEACGKRWMRTPDVWAQTKKAPLIPGLVGADCLACGQRTVGRKDLSGKIFWGCSQYPLCARAVPTELEAASCTEGTATPVTQPAAPGTPTTEPILPTSSPQRTAAPVNPEHPMLDETFNALAARGVPASRNPERLLASHRVAADTAGMVFIHSDDELMTEEVLPTPAEAAANWIVEQQDGGRSRKEAIAEAVRTMPSAEDAAELFEILSQ